MEARENGDIDENITVPFITVIADGAWCKRSYRTAYNARSGAACIVSQRTGKLLFLEVIIYVLKLDRLFIVHED
ncbi:hypothetical protein BDFB_011867 [Asbolus verrucosus]|uniref:Mutator-like transposase domain-containing protein n=1 Tax=Asbolus verrucosus TaxID=1661398 RepID=A0A482VG79_ASBVE|nr:hypothetical protein BDFB_011867 [Asbolus verrucosus]